MIKTLIQLADKFDQNGRSDLACKIDGIIKENAKHKAPLKKLNKGVREDLLKFVHTVSENIKKSEVSLEELFRRLRYFSMEDKVKEFGFDKILAELKKLRDIMEDANSKFYAISYGKKPNRKELEELTEKLKKKEDLAVDKPLEFFESQVKDDEEGACDKEMEDKVEEGAVEEREAEEGEINEEELRQFWEEVEREGQQE